MIIICNHFLNWLPMTYPEFLSASKLPFKTEHMTFLSYVILP